MKTQNKMQSSRVRRRQKLPQTNHKNTVKKKTKLKQKIQQRKRPSDVSWQTQKWNSGKVERAEEGFSFDLWSPSGPDCLGVPLEGNFFLLKNHLSAGDTADLTRREESWRRESCYNGCLIFLHVSEPAPPFCLFYSKALNIFILFQLVNPSGREVVRR